MNFFKFFQNILISSAFLSVIFLVNSCASTKIAPYANEVHSSFSGDDAVSLGKTQESRKSYFSRIDESIMKDVENALGRFRNCTFISFETGGHLMTGHSEEVKKAVLDFIGKQ